MSFWRIVLKSLKHHRFSNSLAAISIAMGIALLVAVYSFKEQSQNTFTQAGIGVDAILAPKGSPLQIVLNAIYHLEDMPGKITWTYFKEVQKERIVTQAIPFVAGHSYGGVRVNAIDARFLRDFEYMPGKTFSFSEKQGGKGRPFEKSHEAVAGWAAAKKLNIRLGQTFNPVCGVQDSDPVHKTEHITFVGILAPTGTPHDRAIYIPLEAFYGLEGHPRETVIMGKQEQHREISGAYLKIKRIRKGAIHPGIQDLKFAINQSDRNQLVVPAEVMPRLHNIIGWVDRVLIAIAIMLTVLASLFLFFSLLQSLREMRRDLALFRALGATRKSVMGLVISEALIISLLGGMMGLALGHWLISLGAHFIKIETGVGFTAGYLSAADWLVIPGTAVLGLIAGLVPGIQAYRLGVLKNLSFFVALMIFANLGLFGICGAQNKKDEIASGKTSGVQIQEEKGPGGHSTIGIVESSMEGDTEKTLALTFARLMTWEYDADNDTPPPEQVANLNGRKVKLTGFMYPLQQGDSIQYFCLLRTTQTCCYGPRPQFNQYVLVEMDAPTPFYRLDPVSCVGKFRVEPMPDEGYVYRMEGEKCESIAGKDNN